MAPDNLFAAPKGTYDLLPPDSWRWLEGTRLALDTFARAGYAPVETPAFEHTEVFERGVGATSEVVNKQMYTFLDKGDRSLTLRPEGTAPVMRAVLEHRLDKGPLPVKLAYGSFMFRQERPQKGRFRQFFQVGIEAIGTDEPAVDAEVIEVGARYLKAMGVRPVLLLNSIGHPSESCRGGYVKLLADWLRDRLDELAPVDRERVETNPLRTFDSKEEPTIEVMRDAPLITDHLCEGCAAHFGEVTSLLGGVAVEYELEPRLVRGLDYYTRTAFEFVAGNLGSQSAVGGGGRYDGLAESLGGDPLPGIGFALGLDRVLLAGDAFSERGSRVDAYVVTATPDARGAAFALATRLRAAGAGADLDLAGRSMKGQMKDAARSGARWAVILGADELAAGAATLRDLSTGEQEQVPLDEVERRVTPHA
ncbi:MAG TPA: histidine--tRNA ligase [Actinomycetota bacterium]|nr:histidine--tRNA ligase [Actinomycetota bacterium]